MVELPILPEMEVLRGDILSVAGSARHVEEAVQALGYADRPLESTDLVTVAGGIALGGLVGALSVNWNGFLSGCRPRAALCWRVCFSDISGQSARRSGTFRPRPWR